MIVFDLKCAQAHVFEAWFGKSADYEDQKARGLLSCPICGDADIGKAVMAPAVPAKSNRAVPMASAPAGDADAKAMLAKLAEMQTRMLKGSDWVGGGFAAEARAMHEGEKPHRTIHGQATWAEAKALVDEGVPVAPLPFPVAPPGTEN